MGGLTQKPSLATLPMSSTNSWYKSKYLFPVILFVDGHPSHQSPEVSEFCIKNGIILYRFPPHATHVLQLCDVALFRSLKSAWYDAERAYRSEHPAEFVTQTTFASELPRTKNWPRVDSEWPASSHTEAGQEVKK